MTDNEQPTIDDIMNMVADVVQNIVDVFANVFTDFALVIQQVARAVRRIDAHFKRTFGMSFLEFRALQEHFEAQRWDDEH